MNTTSAARKTDVTTDLDEAVFNGLKQACRDSGGTYVIENGEEHKLHLLIRRGGHHGIKNVRHHHGWHNQVTLSNGRTLVFDYFSDNQVDFSEK